MGSGTTATTATGGRERAIEALIDREPAGDFYRAARVLDEAVPMAHASRPYCVTKAACIDQATSLSQYAIDTRTQYEQDYIASSALPSMQANENTEAFCASLPPLPMEDTERERIFQYQRQLLAAKTAAVANTKDGEESGPVPQLMAALRHLLLAEEEEADDKHSTTDVDWRTIRRTIATHPLFQDTTSSSSSSPESLLLQLAQTPSRDLTALGLVLLSLVTSNSQHKNTNTNNDAEPIQAGPLLALWPITGATDATIDYYAAAAAVYTERHEILQAATAAVATTAEEPADPMDDESPATPATPATPTEEELPPDRSASDPHEAPDDAAASDSSDDDDDDDEEDDSDDDDDDDDDDEEEEDALVDEDTEDDDDAVLRQAMAMSMVVEEAARALDSLVISSAAHRSPTPPPPANAVPELPPWPEPPSPHEPHPSQLSDFGAVPRPQVIQHLLRYALQAIPRLAPRPALDPVSGVGASLFVTRPDTPLTLPGEPGLTLPLLVSLTLALLQQRDAALAHWRPRPGSAAEEPDDPEGDDLGLLSAEVLEHKGLLRKAAAAAHEAQARDAAALARLRHVSASLSVALPLLRHYVQAVLRQWLVSPDATLPSMAVLARLAPTLAALWSHRVIPGEDAECAVTLYKESILLWGECIPRIYPTDLARWELLQASLEHANAASGLGSLEQLSTLPTSDAETEYYQFQVLCRRLRVRDMLDASVPKPCVFTGDLDAAKAPPSEIDPQGVSVRIAILGNAVQRLPSQGTSSTELEYLYLALCHRCQAHALLFDGFYAHTDTESEDRPSVATAKSLSGDTVRVSSSPSAALQFDTTKCSDSIAVFSSSSGDEVRDSWICSVHQRASKVWGSVLSTQHFSPKTGVHRWAVRLDKCERGHVFIGVSTAQANMKTYVGGDKYGWGMIGTQALWHDRRKIRGDYGATFRTGSIIVVTLDTDAGTLSFSSWKDTSASSSLSVDPLIQNIVSPKKAGPMGGILEDWGVAFEGLPLDAKLYPAIGLYQRDDRVTLLTVDSPSVPGGLNGASEVTGGNCYYPLPNTTIPATQVRRHNDLLSWDGICYASYILEQAAAAVRGNDLSNLILTRILPSLGSALCLLPPSVPILSARCATFLMPRLSKCILEMDRCLSNDTQSSKLLFHEGMLEGHWIIRTSKAVETSSDFEEYGMDFTICKNDDGSINVDGKNSANGSSHTIHTFGCVHGSSLTLVEKWSKDKSSLSDSSDSESECVVAARLSVDGRGFEGISHNVSSGISVQIAGRFSGSVGDSRKSGLSIIACASLLCLAQSHLATLLGEDVNDDLDNFQTSLCAATDEDETKMKSLKSVLIRPLLADTSISRDISSLDEDVMAVSRLYSPPREWANSINVECTSLLSNLNDALISLQSEKNVKETQKRLLDFVAFVDNDVCAESGGFGTLSRLCPSKFSDVRREIICSLLYHSKINFPDQIHDPKSWSPSYHARIQFIWRSSLKILEDGIRRALSASTGVSAHGKCAEVCTMFSHTSKFLLSLQLETTSLTHLSDQGVVDEISIVYHLVDKIVDLKYLEDQMMLASRRGILRLVSLGEVARLLTSLNMESVSLIESIVVGLPRQLGRGKFDRSSIWRPSPESHPDGETLPCLDGNYLFQLAGANHAVIGSIRELVVSLYESLGRISELSVSRREFSGASMRLRSSIDSLMLALMPVFISQLRREDFDEIVTRSRFLVFLPKVFHIHRHNICQDSHFEKDDSVSQENSVALNTICQRDISRAVLRCAVAVAHVITYQGILDFVDVANSECLRSCFGLLLSELEITIPIISESSGLLLQEAHARRSKDDWETYLSSDESIGIVNVDNHLSSTTSPLGLSYLSSRGSLLPSFSVSKSPPPTKASHGGSFRNTSESFPGTVVGFGQQFLSHWLHILCAVLRNDQSVSYILSEKLWFSVLLEGIGLTVDYSPGFTLDTVKMLPPDVVLLPGRFRARLLRLMLPLFSKLDPCEAMVLGLLELGGMTSPTFATSRGLDDEDWIVSRETLSLLRHLHSPLYPTWRSFINKVVSVVVHTESCEFSSLCKKVGALSFFSGNLESICRGSYVLLKPSASSMLSLEQQSVPSSKSHHSGIGGNSASSPAAGSTPHHLIGNGTSSVVSGLCRAQASAGIVSNTDLKNGTCEVILVARGKSDILEKGNAGEFKQLRSSTPSRSFLGGRHTLTVRAVRTSLADVVHAQEVPLFLDTSISCEPLLECLLSSLDRFLGVLSRSESSDLWSDLGFVVDLMAIRCCLVVFSDSRILSSCLCYEKSNEILSKLLSVAWADCGENSPFQKAVLGLQGKSVSQLVVHEARLCYLVSLLQDLKVRDISMNATSELEKETRFERFRSVASAKVSNTMGLTSESAVVSRTPSVAQVSISSVEPGSLVRESDVNSGRSTSHSTTAGNSNADEDDDSETAATAAAHLHEAAIAQMSELGLPRSWSEYALRRTGGVNIEAAVTFCLERGPEIERLITEEQERERSGDVTARRRGSRDAGPSNRLLRQLLEMGFPKRWCAEALSVTGNNVDEALTWILSNGERLSEEDEALETGGENEEEAVDDGADSVDDEDEDDTELDESPNAENGADDDAFDSGNEIVEACSALAASTPSWSGSVIPLRFISGRAIVNPSKMEISGLPNGGFSSVGTKGILLTSGRWYYEAVLETAGCLQIGWADGSFAGHCHADRGDGCGDGPSSWAFDGWRRYRWHATATEWGCRWKEGDVVGCFVDMDERSVSFTLNGEGESVGMGIAFTKEGFRPCGGVYACVSFNRKEKLRLILGGSGSEPFKNQPPVGYRGVGEAVLDAVKERDNLLSKEAILDNRESLEQGDLCVKRFLCDFSDADHGHELTSWAHRYYGSDASVHLGSVRTKHSSTKNSSSTASSEPRNSIYLTRRLQKVWTDICTSRDEGSSKVSRYEDIAASLFEGYSKVRQTLIGEALMESVAISVLLCRKMILHMMVTEGRNFDLSRFERSGSNPRDTALKFWNVVEVCTTLRPAGWVGEAGAMAIAAEALGLCISSNDQLQHRSSGDRRGVVVASDLDEHVHIPVGGIMQILTTVLTVKDANNGNICESKPASAEAAMSGDGGGGILAFLLEGLQSAACKSLDLRYIIVAKIRRGIRHLAIVEYDSDDCESSIQREDDADDETGDCAFESSKSRSDDEDGAVSADARLIAFLSGLLLSKPLQSIANYATIQQNLFEAWSVGLLSASLPWRMICAFTASGILNQNPSIISTPLNEFPTLARFFGRLQSTVARRLWAERAAFPVCSRYAQSMVELVTSVHRAVAASENLPRNFLLFWGNIQVDAATPLPFHIEKVSAGKFWEADEGWISSDSGWDVWTGTVELKPVKWKTPSRSTVRTLMDGGDGPPLVREGCVVVRGIDWDQAGNVYGNVDGKDAYDLEKAHRETEKKALHESERPKTSNEESLNPNVSDEGNIDSDNAGSLAPDPAEETDGESPLDSSQMDTSDRPDLESLPPEGADPPAGEQAKNDNQPEKKSKKIPSPKLPVGTVLSIEPWNGVPGMARRVRWHRTGIEGVYRFGGDGGMYDLCHVDVNNKETKIKKRHPLPESSEQCASRHGFGVKTIHNVLLRIKRAGQEVANMESLEFHHDGILEWPDYGAGVRVTCTRLANGSVIIEERQLLFGSKDTGWTPRFGRPSFVPGNRYVLTAASNVARTDYKALSFASSLYEEISGVSEIDVDVLRNPADGSCLKLVSEMRLCRGISEKVPSASDHDLPPSLSPLPPPLTFDPEYRAQSLSLSRDFRTVSCNASDGCRGTVFGSLGFTKGTHYWEVKLEQADVGSVFIGVAEKPIGSGSGSSYIYDSTPRLNRWHGWGFVNFRATYTSGAERVFGSHCHTGDTVGVMLDCDAGRVSFFFDGLKYGEHILNDLGCAFENLSPFGFNVDGCGSGGSGQGAPSGFENGSGSRYPAQGTIRPRTLWPVIGLRNLGDRVTLSSKWSTSFGTDGVLSLQNIVRFDEILNSYSDCIHKQSPDAALPQWCINEAFSEYKRWCGDLWTRSATRGSGPYRGIGGSLNVDFDASPIACAAASASLGLEEVLLAGDHVKLTRSAGRILQLDEEAVVMGVYQGRLYYKITSQKSEGGSLTEGGGRAWCFDESEVVDGLPFVEPSKGRGVKLPRLARFTCQSSGGLKVIYEKGAVLRSDLEIFDGSEPLGTIPVDTVIPVDKVLDRRVNSCGGLRYRVITEDFGEGWISARIRGGSEDRIVEDVVESEASMDVDQTVSFATPMECALAWYKSWNESADSEPDKNSLVQSLHVSSVEQFADLLSQGMIPGRSVVESDSILTSVINAIGNYSTIGDAVELTFREVVAAISYAHATICGNEYFPVTGTNAATNQATAAVFAECDNLPPLPALLARIALLRSINRRARLGLPWISIRPCQEGSSILGGLCGHGTSPDRAGRSHIADSECWVQVPSMATKIRALRGLLFTSVKRDFLLGIVDATTTPTLLSHDEYELPREIRTVRINRLKAARAMLGDDRSAKRKYSVFSQLLSETKAWGGASLRRGFVAKGHGGQKRAFKVKLIGEGVNDYSGPYREAFTDAMADVLKIEDDSRCSLPVFDPTPNNASSIGESRDLYMFSLNGRMPTPPVPVESSSPAEDRIRRSFASLMVPSDESSREVEESLVFLGRLVGTAFRHGIPLDIPLPLASVWKAITEEPVTSSEKLRELDLLAHKQLRNEAEADQSPLLLWQQRMLNAFTEGLGNVLPVEVLPLLSGEELRELMCGNPNVDVDLLKQVVEYEGYTESDAVIGYFWNTLTEMTTDERKQFLQFVWARNRLPTRESDFDAPFKIQKDTKTEEALPSASTCFFTLTLPEYTSQEALREKLLFAIRNVTTMETDFQTNSAEIAEGYRSF